MSQQEIIDNKCRLYVISPPEINDLNAFAEDLKAALAAGDVACFQLRLKNSDDADIINAAQKLMPICHDHDVAFIMNDRADLALETGADGVHLGQGDGSVADARAVLGDDASIGVTCHDSVHMAYDAGDAGADYVAFGAFFDTTTKDTKHKPDLDILTAWDLVTTVPSVAIGGITVENCDSIIAARAHFMAVSAGVWQYEQGPAAAVKAFNEKQLQGPDLVEE